MQSQSSSIRSLFVNGPAGMLEALLNSGADNANYAALVCHPHPVYGGTMHNKVVFHAMKALNSFGFPVLRFNFRGFGLSEESMLTAKAKLRTCAQRSIGSMANIVCHWFSRVLVWSGGGTASSVSG